MTKSSKCNPFWCVFGLFAFYVATRLKFWFHHCQVKGVNRPIDTTINHIFSVSLLTSFACRFLLDSLNFFNISFDWLISTHLHHFLSISEYFLRLHFQRSLILWNHRWRNNKIRPKENVFTVNIMEFQSKSFWKCDKCFLCVSIF